MKHIQLIESLLKNLPEEDYALGYKYFKNRELEDLLELVKSAIVIGIKKAKRQTLKEYDFSGLERLYLELDLYLSNMGYNEVIH